MPSLINNQHPGFKNQTSLQPHTSTTLSVAPPVGSSTSTPNTSSTNYSAWAANQTFNLGDYLIFNTNTNLTVIQTYDEATYLNCSMDDASDNDTFQYDGGSNQFGEALTIPVPLTIQGPNYYFSDADDGVQCQHGLAFEIVVNHGLGLPPNLNQPPPPPYAAPPSPAGDQSPPINVVSNQPNGGGLRSVANLRWVITVGDDDVRLIHLFYFKPIQIAYFFGIAIISSRISNSLKNWSEI
ncbi:hypothetical protein F0562_019138 [Nyssa sinensis]|uniref:Phytocyanin domain-containing protein n=1 Tax=Nyssa sinensis TaxID=561372 RepID=A0A5J4ZDF0_9ASTE|nr:hypothetical protein F0562_019138 [Nyssa sinensis]